MEKPRHYDDAPESAAKQSSEAAGAERGALEWEGSLEAAAQARPTARPAAVVFSQLIVVCASLEGLLCTPALVVAVIEK
jgi:hypothetical protein